MYCFIVAYIERDTFAYIAIFIFLFMIGTYYM